MSLEDEAPCPGPTEEINDEWDEDEFEGSTAELFLGPKPTPAPTPAPAPAPAPAPRPAPILSISMKDAWSSDDEA